MVEDVLGTMKTVPVDAALLDEASALGVDVPTLVEVELKRRIIQEKRWREWREENREAIESYNREIERRGPAGAEYERYD